MPNKRYRCGGANECGWFARGKRAIHNQRLWANCSEQADPPAKTPAGMAWIPGGEFSMGANDPPDMDEVGMKATKDARPIHRVYVDGFFMDKTDVTNAQFAKFVKATGYVTVAERKPTAGRLSDRAAREPGRRVSRLHAARHPVPLNNHYQWWSY